MERAGGSLSARDVMRADPPVVAPHHTLERAWEFMQAAAMRELPVVVAGAAVGIVTRTDIEPFRGHCEWTSVRAVMTPNPLVVEPEAPVEQIAELLLEHGFNSVLVVACDGVLVGIVSRRDLLAILARTPP